MMWMNLPKLPPLDWREPYPIWTRLAIETSSNCNRSCSFCPISTGKRDFPQRLMKDDLFDSILDQLSDLDWNGVIELFVLNEPLLDPAILERLRALRSATPRSSIYISTNGDPLGWKSSDGVSRSVRRLHELYEAGANVINLNVYDPGEHQFKTYHSIAELAAPWTSNKYRRVSHRSRFIHVSDMRLSRTNVERSDGFFIKIGEERKNAPLTKKRHCARPHRHLLVRYDGKVPLCCAIDPIAKDATIVGDATRQPLVEIWNSEMFQVHRYHLQRGDRLALKDCRTCQHVAAYPHVVRKITEPSR